MMETFDMPNTIDELYEQYGMRDYKEVYSNGTQYIPLFRIKQWPTMNGYDKAIDKHIPKTPDYEGDGYADGVLVYDTWICPCCGKDYEVDCDNYKFCPECGQAIDWEGIE